MNLSPEEFGDIINANRELIQQKWLNLVYRQIAVARNYEEDIIIDSLPKYLVQVANDIKDLKGDKRAGTKSAEIAREHGGSRANIGYDVQDVSLEYSLLRQVIIEMASGNGTLTNNSMAAFNEINDIGLISSIEEFLKHTVITLDRSKEVIQHERQIFHKLFDQIPDPVCIYTGPDQSLEFSNQSSKELFDSASPEQIVLQNLKGEKISLEENICEVFEAGSIRLIEEVLVEKGERKRYFNLTFSPRKEIQGNISGVMMMATEVTSQVYQKKALELQSEALELSMTDAPLNEVLELMTKFVELQAGGNVISSILLTDSDEKHLQFSAAPNLPKAYNEAIDGIPIGPMVGSCGSAAYEKKLVVANDIENDPRWSDFKELAAKYGLKACWSVPILSSQNQLLGTFAFYSKTPKNPDDSEVGIVKVAAQTTALIIERRKEIEDKKTAAIEAKKANRAKSAFLANMSHEIRTPLGAIMGFSDLAKQPGTTEADLKTYLEIVERNSVQVLRIIDDILDLAKVEAGRVELESMEIILPEFLADFGSLFGFKARENGIAFKIVAETDLPNKIKTDPTRLRQILTNAVGNAIKFTRKGSVTLHVCLDGNKLIFGIADTGRGISEKQAESLFKAFSQADSSTTRKFGGTGLGLVLTKHLCQIMGGDYILEKSTPGKGSKFEATINVTLPHASEIIPKKQVVFAIERKPPEDEREFSFNDLSVLLVEDSPENQLLVKLILEKQGIQLEIAENGEEGVKKALEGSHDVVLMDIQMPVMDGHEAVRSLRQQSFQTPIVALTAHAMKEEVGRAKESGFSSFLSKPIKRKALLSLLDNVEQEKTIYMGEK